MPSFSEALCSASASFRPTNLSYHTSSQSPPIVTLPLLLSVARLHHLIGRDTMTPPQLTRYTPVTDVLKPVEPSALVVTRLDLQLAFLHSLDLFSSVKATSYRSPYPTSSLLAAVHPPLRLQHRFNDILRLGTQRDLHPACHQGPKTHPKLTFIALSVFPTKRPSSFKRSSTVLRATKRC